MSWETITVTPPGAISDLADLVDTLKTGLDAMLNFAKAQAEFAKLLSGGINAQFFALKTTLESIISDIEELEADGLCGIIAHPYAEGIDAKYCKLTDTMTLKPSDALTQVAVAFDDGGDEQRPSSTGNLGGIIIVGTAPGVSEFAKILDALGNFFNIDKLKKLKAQILKRFAVGGRPEEPFLSTGIDFYSTQMKDLFPAYVDMLTLLKSKVEGLMAAMISGSSSLDDVKSLIDAQLAELESIVTMISDFLDSFVWSLSDAGVYYQNFSVDSNSAESIKAGLQSDHPAAWKVNEYSIVLGFFAAHESITKLAELIGLS